MRKPILPSTQSPPVPYGAADGAIITHAGRYARECVLLAFEMIGGVERMADWANENPDLFFTRLFPKVVTRELEVGTTQGIEDLLSRLDAAERGAHAHNHPHQPPTLDAEIVPDE